MDVGKETYGVPWMEDPLSWDTTEKSLVTELEEEEGSVAAGVIAAVIVGVLATVALLFSFALLIDCRNRKRTEQQQRDLGKRKSPVKRTTFPQFISNGSSNGDNISFVNQMCVDSTSTPPTALACSSSSIPDALGFQRSGSSSIPHMQTV